MSGLRPELQEIVERLLQESAARGSDQICLDQIGDAIGARAVSTADVESMIEALEGAGRVVAAGETPRGEEHLRLVILSIRELSVTLGRRPTPIEIAAHAGLTQTEVSHALQLTRIMQR